MPRTALKHESARALRWAPRGCALIILANMLWFGRDAFRAVFNGDDVMNLFGYWSQPLSQLLASQLLFFSSSYRPMGALFYLPLFRLAGFHPLPYHLVAFVLMAVNAWLVYRVTQKLSGSWAAAGLAAFLASYHVAMAELYYETGVIYDILCFLIYFFALDYYIGFRRWGELASGRRLLVLAVIYACALNSKEMAVSLPVVLLAYEGFFNGPKQWRPRLLLHWTLQEGRAVWVTGLMNVAYIYGKTHGPDAIANLSAYQGVYSFAQFVAANRAYLVQHFLDKVPFTAASVFLVWGAMLAIGILLRRADLRLLWAWAVATPLPVVFVQRGHSAVYIPFAGLAMFVAIAVLLATGAAARLVRLRPAAFQAAAVIVLAGFFARGNTLQKRDIQHYIDNEGREIWSVIGQFKAVRTRIAPNSKVLLLDSPFENWDLFFIASLWIDDPTVEIWLDRPDHRVQQEDLPSFRYVFRFERGRLVQAPQPAPPNAG